MATRSVGISIDDHELRELDLDLGRAPFRVQINAEKALEQSARDVEREMKVDASGHIGNVFGRPGTEFPIDLARHVSHELVGKLTAEIGIENKGSGSLAHILAFGSVHNPPAYDPYAGPERAILRAVNRFADAAEEAALGRESR